MSDDEKQTSWWSTLPGILTAIAAVITAVTGLVLGFGQLGLFDRGPAESTASGVATSTADPGPTDPEAPAGGPTSSGDTPTSSGGEGAPSGWTVTLPEQRSYRSGDVEYVLLNAEARPDVADQLAMDITIRCTNHGRYDVSFWDSTFRLHAGGVNVAPDSFLNEICPGNASKTGMVRFVFPAEVRDPELRIAFTEGEMAVPLQVAPA